MNSNDLKASRIIGAIQVIFTMYERNSENNMGFMATLQLILIVLKFVGVITWSWWAVFFPLWINIAVYVIAILWDWLGS